MHGTMTDEAAGRIAAAEHDDLVKRLKRRGGNSRGNGYVPPGLTSTTTPGGIAHNDPDAAPPAGDDQIVQLPLNIIDRHPANRVPSKEQIGERAESMQRDGQLEPIVVRPSTHGRLQLISGETRTLAARQLGWRTIAGRIRQADDRQALLLLAAANAQRADLNPIQTAELLHALTKTGVPPAEAAKPFGKSESWAVNLIRLLELPEPWKGRIISGEMDATKARVLVPLVKAPRVLKALDEEWTGSHWTDHPLRDLNRESFTEEVERTIEHVTRSLEGRNQYGDPVLVDVNDPKIRERLDVVELPIRDGYGKTAKVTMHPRITNVDLFDKLQTEARKKKQTAKSARKDAKEAKAKKVEKKLTPAELKARKAKQARQYAERVERWKLAFIRRWAWSELGRPVPQLGWEWREALAKVWLFWAAHVGNQSHLRSAVEAAMKAQGGRVGGYRAEWKGIAPIGDSVKAMVETTCEWLWPSFRDPSELDEYQVPAGLLRGLAEECKFDMAKAWADAQRDTPKGAKELYQRMIELHSRDQLAALGEELKVHVPETATKSGAVKLFLSLPRILPLPAVLKERKKRGK